MNDVRGRPWLQKNLSHRSVILLFAILYSFRNQLFVHFACFDFWGNDTFKVLVFFVLGGVDDIGTHRGHDHINN